MNEKRQAKLVWCQNELGGYRIDPCKTFGELAVVDLTASSLDPPTVHLCKDCAARLKAHLEGLGHKVQLENRHGHQ